jgi:acyl-CoA synthetase (AMP-forming)/AMP-acid ligase II
VHAAFQPFFHIGGSELVFQFGYYGCLSVLMPDFDVERFLSIVETHNVRRVALPPTVINMILDHPRVDTADFSRLRYISYGGSPITPALLRRAAKRWNASFIGLFGQTESTGNGHVPAPRRALCRGRPAHGLGGTSAAGVGAQDRRPGNRCRAAVRDLRRDLSTQRCNDGRLFKQPVATAKTIDLDGWLHTGDIGYVDDSGYLTLRDRVKDMIISGGENIYSAEVEAAVAEHPAVNSVAVIGVPDSLWGEAVKAVVVLHPGVRASEREIIDFTARRIARYKRPKSVDFVDELPRSANNKILKRELRSRYWTMRRASQRGNRSSSAGFEASAPNTTSLCSPSLGARARIRHGEP